MEKMKFNIQMFALSGSDTAYFSSSPGLYIKTVWSATQSTSGNYSNVTVDYYYGKVASGSLTTGGTISGTLADLSNSQKINFSFTDAGAVKMFTLTKKIYHNSSGNASFNVTQYGSIGTGNTASINKTYDLNRIYRYATITEFNANAGGFNKIYVHWSTNVECDAVEYSVIDPYGYGTGWISEGSPDFTIGGLSYPNATYQVKIRVRRADSGLWTESETKYVTTWDINRITSNIYSTNCDTALTVTANSMSNTQNDIVIQLLNANKSSILGSIRHDNTTNTTFTVEEMQSLANYVPDLTNYISANGGYNFRILAITVVDGVDKYTDYKDGTYSIVNANPQFSNFAYKDTGGNTITDGIKTTDLTGNDQIIIKGYSNLRAIISVANKAVAVKGATMVKYRLVVGSKQIDVDYSASSTVNLDLNAIDNNVFTVYAIDSRGNSTSKQISPAIYKDYSPISIVSASSARKDSVEEQTTLIFDGAIWNDSFGNVANSIISCAYKYKKVQGTTYIVGTTPLTPKLSGNTYSLSSLIAGDDGALGFTIGSSFNLHLEVKDKLSTKTYDLVLQTAKPRMDICEDLGTAFGEMYNEAVGGSLQVDGYKVLSTNDIPSIINNNVKVSNTTGGAKVATNEWIDGKQVYRKIINAGTVPNASTTTTSIGETNVKIIRSNVFVYSGSTTVPTSYANPNAFVWHFFSDTTTSAKINIATNNSALSGWLSYAEIYFIYNS